MADDWRIERLGPHHDRSPFDSGEASMDTWLQTFARQNDEKGVGRTYVLCQAGSPRVWGYHTLRSGSVAREGLPAELSRKLPRYPVPVVHLARLAVDRTVRGQRLGERLLIHALGRALVVSEAIAVFAVEVVALDEAAGRFYAKYGFRALPEDPLHLYLSMAAVRRALDPPR